MVKLDSNKVAYALTKSQHDELDSMGYKHKEEQDGYHYMFRGQENPIIVANGDHEEWIQDGYTNELKLMDGRTLTDAEEFYRMKTEGTLFIGTEGHWSSSSDSYSSCSEDETYLPTQTTSLIVM